MASTCRRAAFHVDRFMASQERRSGRRGRRHGSLRLRSNSASRPPVNGVDRCPKVQLIGSTVAAINRSAAARRASKRTRHADRPGPSRARSGRSGPAAGVWRFDVVAGLTAAAVVLPKAMAYADGGRAAGGGRPLHRLRPDDRSTRCSARRASLSVSSTTTLAILAGTELGARGSGRRPGQARHRDRHPDRAGRRACWCSPRLLRLGFVADFISAPVLTGFKAGIGLVIVLDQVPKLLGTPHHQARVLPGPAQRRAARPRDLAG